MPTYDYQCEACGHRFAKRQSFSDDPLTKCPECGRNKLQRLFGTGGAVIFKGAGFYETDYRRAGLAAEKGEGEAAKPQTGETKAETPAPAAEETAAKGESKGSGGAKKKGK
jgi:putative FmdB family regulatory protein